MTSPTMANQDGGRSLAGTPLGEALNRQDERLSHCVHCGFCLPVCPTYVRLGDEADSPRGRLHLMRAVTEGRLDPGAAAYQRHLDRCLGCRACESVCPSGVEYGLLLERAREVAVAARRPAAIQRVLLRLVEGGLLFRGWMLASRLLRASRLPALLARLLPGRRGGLGQLRLGSAMLAASGPGSRVRRAAGVDSHHARSGAVPTPWGPDAAGEPRRVGLLRGCVQEGLFHRVNQATHRVLEANGWEVVPVERQGCCGALHAHGGRMERARELARRNIAVFREADVDLVVANAAGCGATMREYHHLLEEADPATVEMAEWFARRVRDVSELLAGEGRTPRVGAGLALKVAYDAPCHLLHGQRVARPPVRVLESIPGLVLVPLEGSEECCGGAGIYGITHPELGGRIGGDKVEAIRKSGAEVVATGNPGCMMQIGAGLRMAGLPVDVVHPVELLDESYRRAGYHDV
jgi:glycolate oxidase iron-sulfur subunit